MASLENWMIKYEKDFVSFSFAQRERQASQAARSGHCVSASMVIASPTAGSALTLACKVD